MAPILAGEKTQTRRVWKRARVRVGALHRCYTRMPISGEPPFAQVRITAVRRERLGAMTEGDARREGYASAADYREAFRCIYGRWEPDECVWVVDFEREVMG